jgi:hypothetical protein
VLVDFAIYESNLPLIADFDLPLVHSLALELHFLIFPSNARVEKHLLVKPLAICSRPELCLLVFFCIEPVKAFQVYRSVHIVFTLLHLK